MIGSGEISFSAVWHQTVIGAHVAALRLICAPTEIRTPVLGLKGPRPGPLDDGGLLTRAAFYHVWKVWVKSDKHLY